MECAAALDILRVTGHLAAIQRLFELGIASRPDFDTGASVPQGQASRSPAAASPPPSGPSRRRDCFDRCHPRAVSQ